MPYRHGLLCACSGGGPALPSQAGPLSAACSAHTGASVHGAHPTNRVRLAHTACKGPSAEQAGGSRLACCAQRAQACLEADDRARHLVAHDVAGMVEDGSRPAQRMECQRKAEVTTLCACWRAREREREREGSASCRAAKNPTHPASTQRTACPPPLPHWHCCSAVRYCLTAVHAPAAAAHCVCLTCAIASCRQPRSYGPGPTAPRAARLRRPWQPRR